VTPQADAALTRGAIVRLRDGDRQAAGGGLRPRYLAYSAIVCIGFFAGLNWLIEALEDQGLVDTHDPDDQVQHLTERIWERDGDRWVTTTYGSEHFVQDSFSVPRDGPRVFITGGSWALGSPYSYQGDFPYPGSMHSFLEAWLRAELGPGAEVINAGAGGQNSQRVAQVVEEIVGHHPDVLVVATCNNEGLSSHAWLEGWLNEQGGYRLLEKLLKSETGPERTMFTAQDAEGDQVAAAFEANLEAIAASTKGANVPLVLATLPQHLMLEALSGAQADNPDEQAEGDAQARSNPPLPEPPWVKQVNPCLAGLMLQEAKEWELSLALIGKCTDEFSLGPKSELEARARFQLRRDTADDRRVLERHFGSCVMGGLTELRDGRLEVAIGSLSQCEDRLDEALRWTGIALAMDGQPTRAREVLRTSVELNPRNRCRPSFNRIVREVAARHDHVILADLENAGERLAADGIPDDDLFLDSCHMNWRGYGAMSGSLARTLGPMLGADPSSLDSEALGVSWGLPTGDAVEQIVFAATDAALRLPAGSDPSAPGSEASQMGHR